jgi:SAM-dependent methyltransferase
VNDAADLSLFGDGHFDFIYSRLTIQHIPPNVAAGYIPEFGRVLAPGGLIMIQIPTTLVNNPKMWRRTVPDRVWDLWHDLKSEFSAVARCRMFGLPVDTVVDLLAAGGADVIHIAPNDSSGPEWHSYWYLATTRLTAAPSG